MTGASEHMHRNAYVLLLLTTLFWGGNSVAGKIAVDHISPVLLTAARWGTAALIVGMFGWRHLRNDWADIRPKLALLALLATLGFTIFNIAQYTALLFTTAVNSSIEQAGIPMVIFLFNFLFFRLKATALQLVGFLLSVVGIGIVATHGDFRRLLTLDLNLGDALMLVAVVVYALYTVGLRNKPTVHWMSLMIVLCASAFITTLPFAAIEYAAGEMILPDPIGWAVIAYTALLPSIVSQAFYIRGIEMIGANRAGIFVNLVPLFGTLLSIILLGEAFEPYHAVAMVLVFGGIWLAEASGRKAAG
jgi:drug/metabolite transporter (DMT)-like permease